jgi:hypothetical protein
MTPVERVAVELARHFPGINAALIASRLPFRAAVDGALAVMGEDAIVAAIVDMGPLDGARRPYAALIARVRELPALEDAGVRLADETAEARRWGRVDAAAKRGETLRRLVDRGQLHDDEEAAEMLRREFAEDADLRGIAEAALAGGRT